MTCTTTGAKGGREEEVHPVSSMNPVFRPSTERDFIHENGQRMDEFHPKSYSFPSISNNAILFLTFNNSNGMKVGLPLSLGFLECGGVGGWAEKNSSMKLYELFHLELIK
jgi:hypothetical protein